MSQKKQISQMINSVLADDFATANTQLKGIMENQFVARIREIDSQLEEGFFDRLGAHAAGAKAGIGAKLSNFATGVKGAAKAGGQAIKGDLGKAALTLGKTQGAINKNNPKAAQNTAALESLKNTIANDIKKLFPNVNEAEVAKILAAIDAAGPRLKAAIPNAKAAPVNPGIGAPLGGPVLPSATP